MPSSGYAATYYLLPASFLPYHLPPTNSPTTCRAYHLPPTAYRLPPHYYY